MSARRYDLNRNPLTEVIHVTECGDCKMGLVSETEYHPYLACLIFKHTHNSDIVWAALSAQLGAEAKVA
jgi:hypothetical protein